MAELDLGAAQPTAAAFPPSSGVDLGPATPDDAEIDHTGFIERVDRGSRFSRLWDAFKGGASEGYGDSPLGIDPSGEAQKYLQEHGIFHDPANAKFGDSLRMGAEAVAKPVAAFADLVGRVVAAGGNGLADALNEDQKVAYEQVGAQVPTNQQVGPALKSGLEWALTDMESPLVRTTQKPDGRVVDEPVGGLAKDQDFQNVSRLITPADEAIPGAVTGEIGTGYERPVANGNSITKEGSLKQIATGAMDMPTGDELTEAHQDIKSAEQSDLAEAFNGDAKKAAEFHRLMDADYLSASGRGRLEALRGEAKDIPERVYEDRYALKDLAPTFRDLEQNPDKADHIVNRYLSDLPPGDRPANRWTTTQASAMAVVRKAAQEVVKSGNSPAEFTQAVLKRYTSQFSDPQDAQFMAEQLKSAMSGRPKGLPAPEAPAPVPEAPQVPYAERAQRTSDKLKSLYQEYNIHPSEVLSDVQSDPTLAAHLNSDSPILPPRYTGMDPEAIKAEQIVEARGEPPLADGMVRLYHGHNGDIAPEDFEGKTDFTTDKRYARGYANKSGDKAAISYVDIPSTDPRVTPEWEDQGLKQGFHFTFKMDAEEAKQRGFKWLDTVETPGSPKGIAGNSDNLNEALQTRTSWPQTPDEIKPPTRSAGWGQHIGDIIDRAGLGDITNDLQRAISPMAMRDASTTARSTAKDFANAMRVQRWDWQRLHTALTEEFSPDELKDMWNKADEDLVATQKGEKGEGLSSLPARQQGTVQALQRSAAEAWKDAKSVGMVKGEGLGEGYVPRKVLFDYGTSEPGLFRNSLDALGRNLKTSTANILKRKYLTTEETEAAAQNVNSSGKVVRDIRTLPLVTSKLNEAVAGRKLINAIRDAGEATTPEGAESTVYEGAKPSNNFFTIDGHPAFTTWKPRFKDGKTVRDADGNIVFDKTPLYVRKDFEGPLRAVLSQNEGLAYRAIMDMKARSTQAIMYSPLLHNAVIAGRVLPAMGGNPIATARLYMKGAVVRANPEMMREAIANGLAPIGRGGGAADWAKTLTDPQMKPGRSLTSQILSYIPGLFDKGAGDAVKRAVDIAGEFWHNTLLWNRVADMQAGIYDHYIQDAMQAGIPRDAAAKTAAHLANRYAGSIPMEALSQNSRKIANVLLFSRSFTMGTVGSIKDAFTGMPRDVLAQIERDQGTQMMLQTKSYAQRKALGIVAADIALLYAGGSITQSTINVIRGDSTIGEEGQGYADRFSETMKRMEANPMEFFNPLAIPNGVASNSENEPGREHHILTGYQSDGTAVYSKNPTGKTAEDMIGWMTKPAQTLYNKLSTFARPTWDTVTNQDFAGRHIYDPNPQVPEDYMRNIGKVVLHYMAAQVPEGSFEAAGDLLFGTPTDDEKHIDTLKIVGPLVGLMFSPGAPGGPAAGEYFKAQEQNKYAMEQALPQAKKAIKEGRIDEAHELMDKANINPKLQKFFVETTLNPETRFARKAFKQYMNGLPEEQQERLNRQLEQSEK